MNRTGIAIFTAGFACTAFLVASGLGGCQSSSTNATGVGGGDETTGSTNPTSTTGSLTTTGATMATTGTGGASQTSTGASMTTTTSGNGGGPSCAGQTVQISDITGKTIGPKEKVEIKGAVVMSQKFLVSKAKSGSCLWGLYISAPGLAETTPGSGLLALSYGTDASIVDGGKSFCPELGVDPVGDKLPDDAKPGDVIDIIGVSDYFVLPQCAMQAADAGATNVAQFQLANVCSATKTGTAAVPKAHVLSAPDELKLADQTDQAFHDQWGGVKVEIQNVTAIEAASADGGVPPGGPVDGFGVITLDSMGGNLEMPDTVYYQGYAKKADLCHAGPVFSTDAFTSIAGFNTINFCTWSLYVNNKCVDFVPPSEDCKGNLCP